MIDEIFVDLKDVFRWFEILYQPFGYHGVHRFLKGAGKVKNNSCGFIPAQLRRSCFSCRSSVHPDEFAKILNPRYHLIHLRQMLEASSFRSNCGSGAASMLEKSIIS